MGVIALSVYRRLARSKKGMSTIFGGLFFIILVLMSFNLMLWYFVQYDSYNRTITTMSERDQQAISENLVVNQPGASSFGASSFNISVTNLGGSSVNIQRIYINNLSPTGSAQCSSSASINPCTADTTSNTNSCVSGVGCYLSNGNIQLGELNHQIQVTGLTINDGSGYKIVLSTTRGRLFSFYYPWPQTLPSGGNGNLFLTNIGPLALYFDYKSFNFTQGSQTQSQPAFCVPSGTTILLWLKLVNQATDSDVKLEASTTLHGEPYGANGFGKFVRTFIVDPSSVNPTNIVGYNFNTNPYDLPAAGPNGPGAAVIVKFGTGSQGGTGGVSFSENDNWLTFIGIYYIYRGQTQGETIPFVDMKDTGGYPGTC